MPIAIIASIDDPICTGTINVLNANCRVQGFMAQPATYPLDVVGQVIEMIRVDVELRACEVVTAAVCSR